MKTISASLIAITLCASPAFALDYAFDAAQTSASGPLQQFGGGEGIVVGFPTIYTNTGGKYSAATSKYTVPTSGMYIFAVDVGMKIASTAQCDFDLEFVINGASATTRYADAISIDSTGSGLIKLNGTMIRKMSAGNTVQVHLYPGGTSCFGAVEGTLGAHFSGGKI